MRTRSTISKEMWTMRLLAFLCALVLLLPPASSGPAFAAREAGSDFVSTDTREGRLAVFDDVWETIDERYYDPDFGGIDWNGPRSAFRRSAANARGSHELYEVLRRMIGSLKDPHTRVYSPVEKFDWWNPRFVTVGLSIREIEGVPSVVNVDPKSAAARAGIRPGDEIEAVDGVAVAAVVRQKLRTEYTLNTSRSVRLRAVATLLEGEAGTSARISWKTNQGAIKSAVLPRYWTQRKLGFDISRKEGKYLVVDIQGFTQSLSLELVRSLKDKLRGARGVVLDLRDNGGGDADAMAEIAALFLGEGVSLGAFTDRAGASLQLMTHSKSALEADRAETGLPLVVLISERTSSAAEILAAVLQAHRRARLVGTPTCGCVLAIRSRHTLPDEGVLDVSEFDYKTSDGVRLEGRGVQPEDLFPPQRRDLYSKHDRALDVALEMLERNTKP